MEVTGGAVTNAVEVVALAEVKEAGRKTTAEEAHGEDIRTTEVALLEEAAHDNGSNQTSPYR
jgi:hypothetical protein